MLNMDSEIVKSLKASAFTLIVAFVCVALVGLALIPLLPVKLNPSRRLLRMGVLYQILLFQEKVLYRPGRHACREPAEKP